MTRDELQKQIGALENEEVCVETNSGTYGAEECCTAVGSGDSAFGDYSIFERVAGGQRTQGCDPAKAPGRARRLNIAELASRRKKLSRLREELRRTS